MIIYGKGNEAVQFSKKDIDSMVDFNIPLALLPKEFFKPGINSIFKELSDYKLKKLLENRYDSLYEKDKLLVESFYIDSEKENLKDLYVKDSMHFLKNFNVVEDEGLDYLSRLFIVDKDSVSKPSFPELSSYLGDFDERYAFLYSDDEEEYKPRKQLLYEPKVIPTSVLVKKDNEKTEIQKYSSEYELFNNLENTIENKDVLNLIIESDLNSFKVNNVSYSIKKVDLNINNKRSVLMVHTQVEKSNEIKKRAKELNILNTVLDKIEKPNFQEVYNEMKDVQKDIIKEIIDTSIYFELDIIKECKESLDRNKKNFQRGEEIVKNNDVILKIANLTSKITTNTGFHGYKDSIGRMKLDLNFATMKKIIKIIEKPEYDLFEEEIKNRLTENICFSISKQNNTKTLKSAINETIVEDMIFIDINEDLLELNTTDSNENELILFQEYRKMFNENLNKGDEKHDIITVKFNEDLYFISKNKETGELNRLNRISKNIRDSLENAGILFENTDKKITQGFDEALPEKNVRKRKNTL